MKFTKLQTKIKAIKGVENFSLIRDNVIKLDMVKDLSKDFFTKMKSDFHFEHCSLITAIDNQPNFELVYHLSCLSGAIVTDKLAKAVMLEVHIHLERTNPHIDSVSDLWFGANWHEREAFDLMGIYFVGHPDLRRVLLPEGFAGHPLRKDYVYEIHEEEW